MKARCDWCGIQVEVLSDGKCLLGHPVKRANKVSAPIVHEPPPERPPGIGITPARGRVRSASARADRRPKAPSLGDAPPVVRPAASAPPAVSAPATTLPKISDGPTRLRKAAGASKPATPARATATRVVPRPATPAPAAAAPAATKTMRKWVPLDPYGPSGPVEIRLDEPAPATTSTLPPPDRTPAPASAREPAPMKASAGTKTVEAPMPAPPQPRTGPSFGDTIRGIDWRSGTERTRDASLAALRKASTATAAAASATARAGRAAGGAVRSIDLRAAGRKFGPLGPQNPAMWVLGLCVAGVALLIGLRTPGETKAPQVLGSRIVAPAAELTEVPGYTLEADPATEAEVAAQQPSAKKVSAANVREGNRILARYQAIAFGPEIRWTPQRQREWLAAYARGAQIASGAFAERPLGRRSVWSAPLGTGSVIVYFHGSEVMVLVTGQQGAPADRVVDAVLSARGV